MTQPLSTDGLLGWERVMAFFLVSIDIGRSKEKQTSMLTISFHSPAIQNTMETTPVTELCCILYMLRKDKIRNVSALHRSTCA